MADYRPEYMTAISAHCQGIAAASEGNFDAPVPRCPGWTVQDLVAHVTQVHWFWSTIVEERLREPPDDSRRPAQPPPAALISTFLTGADRLVRVLGEVGWQEAVWTWAPTQQNVGFVARHQVQEAAIHHWDALSAQGERLEIAPSIATDSIDEFLTFSLYSDADPADPPRPPLGGALVLRCSDHPNAWTLSDGLAAGTVRVVRGAEPGYPVLEGTASDLLLWLYKRVELDLGQVPADLAQRLRNLCFTD